MKCYKKLCYVIATIFVTTLLLSIGIIFFIDAGKDMKHHWDSENCTLNYVSNNTWKTNFNEYTTINVTFTHKDKIWKYATVVEYSHWIVGNNYPCWVYYTFPIYPTYFKGVRVYINNKTNPNDDILVGITIEITFGIIIIFPVIIGIIIGIIFILKNYNSKRYFRSLV